MRRGSQMIDGLVTGCVYAVKFLRFMILWIALYVVEKVFQDAYVSNVLVRDGKPPDLRPLVVYALLVDFVFFTVVMVILQLLRAQNASTGTNYAIDSNLMSVLVVDYIASVAIIGGTGWGVATVIQDRKLLRYRDDGLRSIRALGTLLLYGSMVLVLLPYYVLLT